MKTILGLLLHPFPMFVICLIVGSFGIFNNVKFANDTIPTFFYSDWSIWAGVLVYLFGLGYVGVAIYKTIKKK